MSVEQIKKQLLEWAEEALELRHGESDDVKGKVGLPAFEAGQFVAVDMLQRVRVRLDRVEELQSKARQVKGRIARLREGAEFEANRAYAEAMQEQGARRIRDYVTAAEKNSDATLGSLQEKREAHQMKVTQSLADEVYDVVTQCYWGLEKLREDIFQMLKLHTSLSAVEVQT